MITPATVTAIPLAATDIVRVITVAISLVICLQAWFAALFFLPWIVCRVQAFTILAKLILFRMVSAAIAIVPTAMAVIIVIVAIVVSPKFELGTLCQILSHPFSAANAARIDLYLTFAVAIMVSGGFVSTRFIICLGLGIKIARLFVRTSQCFGR